MPLNVAEACSGIRMLMLFLRLAWPARFIDEKSDVGAW